MKPGQFNFAFWLLPSSGGTPETNRTSDLPLRRGPLYPLSYRGQTMILTQPR